MELIEIGFPIFSYGNCSAGPQRLDLRNSDALKIAHFGDLELTNEDTVFADADGVLFVSIQEVEQVLSTAMIFGKKSDDRRN